MDEKTENRERNRRIHIRFNEQEYQAFMEYYKKSGLQTQRDFILAMCLNGYLVKVDTSGLNRVAEEINRIGVNINQIAHRVNSTDALSITGMIMLQNNMADLYSIIRKEFARYGKQGSGRKTGTGKLDKTAET